MGVTTPAAYADAGRLQPTATSAHTGPIEAARMLRWLPDEEANARRSERGWRESDRVVALTRRCLSPYSRTYSNRGAQPLAYTTVDDAR
jgi:hypothetical protein